MTADENVFISDIYKNYRLPFTVVYRVYRFMILGYSRNEINSFISYHVTPSLYRRLYGFIAFKSAQENNKIQDKIETIEKRYWKDEQEMIIPEYTFNDLSESEKLIFNEL
jgi:hypothetical protein